MNICFSILLNIQWFFLSMQHHLATFLKTFQANGRNPNAKLNNSLVLLIQILKDNEKVNIYILSLYVYKCRQQFYHNVYLKSVKIWMKYVINWGINIVTAYSLSSTFIYCFLKAYQ